MTHNTQGLDEILFELTWEQHKLGMDGHIPLSKNEHKAKQAILQWVNDEVIGKNELRQKLPTGGERLQITHRNRLRDNQRNVLKSHGWKEGK